MVGKGVNLSAAVVETRIGASSKERDFAVYIFRDKKKARSWMAARLALAQSSGSIDPFYEIVEKENEVRWVGHDKGSVTYRLSRFLEYVS